MKYKVPVAGTVGKTIIVEQNATVGSVVGVNLTLSDGTVVTPQQILNSYVTTGSPSTGTGNSQIAFATWGTILDIPPNVTALADTATTGLYTITGAGTSATRTIDDTADIEWTNADGVAGNPSADLTLTGVVADTYGSSYSVPVVMFDAKGRATGASEVPVSVFESTGIISGGVLSINADPTKFDLTAGYAMFMDHTAPQLPVQNLVAFGPFTAVTVTNIGSQLVTYIAIDDAGDIVQFASPLTPTERRSYAFCGAVIHSNLTTINAINDITATVHSGINQLHDLMNFIGPLNLDGNEYTANGANLNIDVSGGYAFKFGCNFWVNNDDPHRVLLAQGTAITFRYRLQDGTEYPDTTDIDPDNYDVGGVLTPVSNNKFTVQLITRFQSGLTRIQYGQTEYNTMNDAIAALGTEDFVVETNIAENGIIRSHLVVQQGAVDLSDSTQAQFFEVPKFGGAVANAGGALTYANIVAALGYVPEPTDPDLTAIAALTGTGFSARTAADTWALRTITGTAGQIDVANGGGVAGNPTVSMSATYVGQPSITTLGTVATGTWNATAIGLAYGGTGQDYSTRPANTVWAGPTTGADAAPTFRALVADDIPDLSGEYQPLDATLTALAGLTIAANSLTIGTGADAFSQTTFSANTFPARASTGSLEAKTITDFGLSLVDDATASDARSTLGLVIGTDVQAWDATLDTFAAMALTGTADDSTFLSGDGTYKNGVSGNFGVGSTSPAAAFSLSVTRDMDGATAVFGIYSAGQVKSAATSSARYNRTVASVENASFTCGNIRHYDASAVAFGASATVTNQVAFFADSSLTGATNNYGFQGAIASSTGRLNLNMSGTADNVIRGNCSFGKTTAPAAKVDIAAGSATAGTAPLKFTSGTVLTAAVAGVMEYDNSLWFTQSDATRRYVVQATNATKTTAGAPYANDGYITIRIGGTDVKVMTTA